MWVKNTVVPNSICYDRTVYFDKYKYPSVFKQKPDGRLAMTFDYQMHMQSMPKTHMLIVSVWLAGYWTSFMPIQKPNTAVSGDGISDPRNKQLDYISYLQFCA